ncbi:MAG: flagellar biosynthetic protein FliO [Planctomycetaceae bacterium]
MRQHVKKMSPRGTGSSIGLVLVTLFTCVVFASKAFAQDDPVRKDRDLTASIKIPPRSSHESSGKLKSSSSGGGVWTTLLSLTAIVGTLGAVGYFAKPYLGTARGLPVEALELLGRRAIEQKVAIHLIRCGSRVLVVGVSPEGARTLSEITDPAEVQRLIDTCHAPPDSRSLSSFIPPFSTARNPRATSSHEDSHRG